MRKKVFFFFFIFLFAHGNFISAQNSYKHSLGLTIGKYLGVAYKGYLGDRLVIHSDLCWNVNYDNYLFFESAVNLLYQNHFANEKLLWFVGGGLIGAHNKIYPASFVKENYSIIVISHPNVISIGGIGANIMCGIEYVFEKVPLSLFFYTRFESVCWITPKIEYTTYRTGEYEIVTSGWFNYDVLPDKESTTKNLTSFTQSLGFSIGLSYTFKKRK